MPQPVRGRGDLASLDPRSRSRSLGCREEQRDRDSALMSRFPSCTAKPALLMFCLPWSSGGQVGAPGNQREKKQHLGPG